MENLKIRVNNKSESKEAQELFFELEYSWNGNKIIQDLSFPVNGQYWLCTKNGMGLFNCIKWGAGHDSGKLITLPELHDLVVLKRNDRKDANVSEENCLYDLYLTESKELYFYHCGKNKWILSNLNGDDDYYELLKPIEKKEMKEYLVKSQDGKWHLETDLVGDPADEVIEIPEGCNIITCENRKGNLVYFHWKSLDSDEFFLKDEKIWSNNFNETLSDFVKKNEVEVKIIWSRHTHPEELPFIDDEPIKRMKAQDEVISIPKSELEKFGFSVSLNDQYAEIEKVRQSHRTASEIADSALKHIRERAETYDQPTGERSAAKTAKAFNAITGKDITESEVWLLLQLLKDVRQWSREDYHQDSAEDCIAYAALKAESLEGGE